MFLIFVLTVIGTIVMKLKLGKSSVFYREFNLFVALFSSFRALGPVVQKLINANPRLKVNQGVYFTSPRCCSTLIFGKTLH